MPTAGNGPVLEGLDCRLSHSSRTAVAPRALLYAPSVAAPFFSTTVCVLQRVLQPVVQVTLIYLCCRVSNDPYSIRKFRVLIISLKCFQKFVTRVTEIVVKIYICVRSRRSYERQGIKSHPKSGLV